MGITGASHGGDDPGATSGNVKEKDLTLMISKYMYDKFKQLGYPVTLTRNTDETVNPSERVDRILNAYGDNENVIVISNHINSSNNSASTGAEVIYAIRNNSTLAKNVLNALGLAGLNKRSVYQRRLPTDSTKDYYFIHRNTGNTQPIIVEYGFINNKGDLNKIQNNYKTYVDAVVGAVISTIGVKPNTYVVKNGDTLYKIANQYGVTIDNIKSANNLTSDLLNVGQILTIPVENATETPGSTTTYVVKSGDTLYKIANEFNTTVTQLKLLNNLTSNMLMIGQILKIPTESSPEESNSVTYEVKKGDTLYKIANNYNVTVDDIRRLNNLTNDILSIGQKLLIPTTLKTYIVKSGDTLYKIANEFNTTVDIIKSLNNLNSNLLSVGQILLIPTK